MAVSVEEFAHPPFTQDEIDSFHGYQNCGYTHPFTCGIQECRDDLVAREDGLHCPAGHYRQNWCWPWMVNWGWKKAWEAVKEIQDGKSSR